MSERIAEMIGNVHAEVVPQGPTQAQIEMAMEAQGMTSISNKKLIRAGLTLAIPTILSGCNLLDEANTPEESWQQLGTAITWTCCLSPVAILVGLGIGMFHTNSRRH